MAEQMINKGVSGVILPQQQDDSGKSQMQEMLAIMQAINAQKEQARREKLEELRVREGERRNEQDTRKYDLGERKYQNQLQQQIESETEKIIDKKLTPLVGDQKKNWQESRKLLGSIKEVNRNLTLGMADKKKMAAFYDMEGLKTIEKIIEKAGGADKTSVMHPSEMDLVSTTIETFPQRLWRKWLPIFNDKKMLNKEQAQELIDDLNDLGVEKFDAYNNSYRNYLESHDSIKSSLNPNSSYRKRWFNSKDATIGHENNSDDIYNEFSQIKQGRDLKRKLEGQLESGLNDHVDYEDGYGKKPVQSFDYREMFSE